MSFRTAALDFFFPPACLACDGTTDDDFCVPCRETLVELDSPCPRCATPRSHSVCPSCAREHPPYDAARAVFAFGGALADALRLLKFSARTDLGERLGQLLRPSLVELTASLEAPLIVPVPLSRPRLAERGFNQAALIALGASPFVCVDRLRRIRHAPPQVGRSAHARKEAVLGAFAAPPRAFEGRDVVLIDDVMTTGATLAACARASKAAGARRVVALTVARALP